MKNYRIIKMIKNYKMIKNSKFNTYSNQKLEINVTIVIAQWVSWLDF